MWRFSHPGGGSVFFALKSNIRRSAVGSSTGNYIMLSGRKDWFGDESAPGVMLLGLWAWMASYAALTTCSCWLLIVSERSSLFRTTSTEVEDVDASLDILDCMSAAAKRYKYLRRLIKFDQMDFEFAFWQMWYLFTAPQKVYRNFHYRKQTKSQFARDDPAFLVLLSFWLCVSSIVFAFVLRLGFWGFVKFLLFVSNKYLIKPACQDQDVEWGYAFDVHLNAFFPLLIILHMVQLFFYNVLISQDWFVSKLFGNSLWLLALGLSILHKTQLLLYPLTVLAIVYIILFT
uniref:Uncharacterized protein n=1 Tax=Timema cristinae TaxID=61476 RepID=A0A7R9GTL7_TIMCR|nr:unnamed protein product [Timema cristinae]